MFGRTPRDGCRGRHRVVRRDAARGRRDTPRGIREDEALRRARPRGSPMTDAPDAVLARMRGDWDRRAAEDHKLHIATGHAGSEETFLASGLQDLEGIVLDGVVLAPSAETPEIGCGVGRLLLPLPRKVSLACGVTSLRHGRVEGHTAATANVTSRDGRGASRFADARGLRLLVHRLQHIPDRGPIRRRRRGGPVLKPGGGPSGFSWTDGRWWCTIGRSDTYKACLSARARGSSGHVRHRRRANDGHYY